MKQYNAYILAGGKSSRMGSDKGLLPLNNEVFVEKISNQLNKITNSVYVITSNEAYKNLNLNCIEDVFPDKGPVGGIYTALTHSENEQFVIISCDAPLINQEVIMWLIMEHEKSNSIITFPTYTDKDYPLIGIYSKKLAPIFLEAIQQDSLKLRSVLQNIDCNIVALPAKFRDNILNINTKEEYYKLIENENFN